ncbi:MAG: hypothetical protein EBU93_05450, partial [Chlamydiae bacterium]|nr:hypothetical protein [Chlamydiota bacterium]
SSPSLLEQIRAGKKLKTVGKDEEERMRKAIEDCEKDLRKMYHSTKGCIDKKLTKAELEEIERLEKKMAGIAIAAEKLEKKKAKDDDDWDE